MFKLFRKILAFFIISLYWTQLGFAEEENIDHSLELTDQNTETNKEYQDKLIKARQLLKLDDKNFNTAKNQHQMINDAQKGVLDEDGKIQEARNLLHEDLINQRIALIKKRELNERNLTPENLKGIDSEEAYNRLSTENKNKFLNFIASKIDLTKQSYEQSDEINTLLSYAKEDDANFINALKKRIQSLSSNEITTLNDQYIPDLKPEQIKSLTPEQIQKLTIKQIKALLERPDLLVKLNSEQIQALNLQALANTIKGDIKSNIANKITFSKNYVPNSFVNALTPEQAKAIMDMHETSKGWIVDSNDLRYYFSDTQIAKLQTKEKSIDPKINDLLNQFITNRGRTTLNLEDSKIEDIQTIVNTYLNKVNASPLFTPEERSSMIDKFFKTYIEPINDDISSDLWAMNLVHKKTGDKRIEIVDMSKIDPKQSISDQYQELQKNGTITKHRDGYLGKQSLLKEYGRYFVAKKLNPKKSIEDQTQGFSQDIILAIKDALIEKLTKDKEIIDDERKKEKDIANTTFDAAAGIADQNKKNKETIENLQEELKNNQAQHTAEMDALQAQLEKQKAEMEKLQEQKSQEQAKLLSAHGQEKAQLQSQLDAQTEEMKELQEKLKTQETQSNESRLKSFLENLKNEENILITEKDGLTKKRNELVKENTQEENQTILAKNSLDSQDNAQEEVSPEIEKIYENFKSHNSDLNDLIERNKKEITQRVKAILDLEKDIDKLELLIDLLNRQKIINNDESDTTAKNNASINRFFGQSSSTHRSQEELQRLH